MTDYRFIARAADDWGWQDLEAVALPGHLPPRIVWAALNFHARTVWGEPLSNYVWAPPEHLYAWPAPCPDPAWCGCGTTHRTATKTTTTDPITLVTVA
ncbi:hypothetical protein KBZ21_06035 [Streptomyces sp. A73]|nr:hypothetical protein [Streptomyces sp. A73]